MLHIPVLIRAFFVICLFTTLHTLPAVAQHTETVEGKKYYECTQGASAHDANFTNNFSTPEAAVDHYISAHMPGYQLKAGSIEIMDVGWVNFHTHKKNQPTKELAQQAQKVDGKVACPEFSDQISSQPFPTRRCQCDNGYVAKGSKCYEDTCGTHQGLTSSEVAMRNEVTKRLREIVSQVNQEFATNGIPSDKESIKMIFKNNDAYQKAIQNASNPKLWPALYGQVIEGMTAMAVENDTYLASKLKYVPWDEQIKPGGGPDFKGQGELPERVQFDVTTNDNADSKMNNPSKQCYQYATYNRLVDGYNQPINKKLKPF